MTLSFARSSGAELASSSQAHAVRPAAAQKDAEGNPAWHSMATRVQTELMLGTGSDHGEQVADRVADQVLACPSESAREPQRGAAAQGNSLQRMHPSARTTNTQAESISPKGGDRLPNSVRALFEPRFGHEFSDIHIHTDGHAARSAHSLQALAYTAGNHVVFGAGQYSPDSPAGRRLLAHELAHVVQQRASGPAVQCQQVAAPTTTVGSLADIRRFATQPQNEPDPTLRTAMGLWSRYRSQVRIEQVDFRLLTDTTSRLGHSRVIGGRSHWEGNTPVIEVPQAILDDVAHYLGVRGAPAAGVGLTEQPEGGIDDLEARRQLAPLERAHEAVRVLGHELHHLWREKSGHASNPLHPVYEAEAQQRFAQVRTNWLEWIRSRGEGARRTLGIPRETRIERWEDIPASVRENIEHGATQTDFIDGLYQRSAYLVEEIYTKIVELSYLRVQQRDRTLPVYDPSRWAVSALALDMYFLHNVMNADPAGPVTPDLVARADREILAYLRQRYPSSQGSQYDSFEVIFFLCAIHIGLPPLYSGGRFISRVPPGARLPP